MPSFCSSSSSSSPSSLSSHYLSPSSHSVFSSSYVLPQLLFQLPFHLLHILPKIIILFHLMSRIAPFNFFLYFLSIFDFQQSLLFLHSRFYLLKLISFGPYHHSLEYLAPSSSHLPHNLRLIAIITRCYAARVSRVEILIEHASA